MCSDVGLGPYNDSLKRDVERELGSVRPYERDRALGVGSALGLQNGHDSWRTGSVLQGRSCRRVSRAARHDERRRPEESKKEQWHVAVVRHLDFL